MLENILSRNELNFNQLEKEFFKIGCEYASGLLTELLEYLDGEIAKNRDKELYRHKGKRKTVLKTLMGEVKYKRAVYESKNDAGEKVYVYLLDEMMKLEIFGKVSTNLAYKIAENACISSYRNSAKNISELTGQSISHGGVWQVVQSLGSKIKEVEDKEACLASKGQLVGEEETKILFEEADGVWINMQGKDRPKTGKKREMKVAVAYDGWKEKSADRYELNNKVAVAGMETSEEEKKKLNILHRYLSNNKAGLIPYKERGLDLPEAPEGIVYRQLGTMEHHICDIITQRMKHRKSSWSICGAEHLAKILTHKVCGSLFEKMSNLSKIILPEKYSEEIVEVISAAKSPSKDGKGYRYPVTGSMPFAGVSVTNGRKAIQRMVRPRFA